jgi:hypothetical protein
VKAIPMDGFVSLHKKLRLVLLIIKGENIEKFNADPNIRVSLFSVWA